MSNHEELIATFTSITGLGDRERVEFYLEAAGWELEPALSSYFEAGEEGGQEDAAAATPVAMGNQPQLPPQQQQPTNKPPPQQPAPRTNTPGGIATLDTLRQQQQQDDDDNSDDDKQAFYAGGSQNSGQQVLGPGSGREDLVKDMFKGAREHGAEEAPAPPQQQHHQLRRPAGPTGSFSGAGYTLEGGQQPPTSGSSEGGKPPTTTVVLRLWSTGFTLNEGPLRDYHEEGSRAFLDSVRRGEIPPELLSQHPGNEIDLTMEDRHHEEYKPAKPISKPFQGVGNVLCSPSSSSVVMATQPSPSELINLEKEAASKLNVDESQETTNVQLRLADGSRIRIRVNLSHTVGDLHGFINGARPHYASTNYVLALFPNNILDQSTTIGGGGLKNSSIVQKMR